VIENDQTIAFLLPYFLNINSSWWNTFFN